MSIVVMLNNYFHDFSVAVLVACLLVLAFIESRSREGGSDQLQEWFSDLYRWMRKILLAAWMFIIVGGIIRTLTYAEYEWSEAAGRGQITALIIKHILLISLVIWGVALQRRLRRRLIKTAGKAETV